MGNPQSHDPKLARTLSLDELFDLKGRKGSGNRFLRCSAGERSRRYGCISSVI